MGCGASNENKADPENALWVFISKTRNAGVTKKFLVNMPEAHRKGFVDTYEFNPTDSGYILKNWSKLGENHDLMSKKIDGISFRERLDIPQEDDSQGKIDRKKEIEDRRKIYAWKKTQFDGLDMPPFVEKVPAAEDVGAAHKAELFKDIRHKEASLKFNHAIDVIHNKVLDFLGNEEDPFKDYADLYRTATVPRVAEDWKTDAQFAQQRFNGINPTLIKKINKLPEKFPVTDEEMTGVLPEGQTLSSMGDAHRLFLCDLKELEDLPAPADRFLTAPLALFFLDNDKKLMPAAIQLYQTPTSSNPIFTPNPEHTHPGAWLAAKTHFQTADGCSHEVVGHYCATHAYIEVIYISMMRNLSVWHPISELVRPHFWFTMVIQDKARSDLIDKEGAVARLMACGDEGKNKLLAKSYTEWKFSRYNLPKRLARRGLDNAEEVPNVYYRDDGLKFYFAVEKYISNLVDDFYKSDPALILGDNELQAWAAELSGELKLRELPVGPSGSFDTKAQIVDFLTGLIFTATAGHSMVNNGQWDYWGFIPNLPATFRLKPPTNAKQEITELEIAKAMPGYDDTADQIALVHVLSRTTPNKKVGAYTEDFMAGRPNVLPMVKAFQNEMAELSTSIQKRNKECGTYPYPYLDPEHVSNTCDI